MEGAVGGERGWNLGGLRGNEARRRGWRGHTSGDRRGGGGERLGRNGERQRPQLGWRGHMSGDRRGGGGERLGRNGERQRPQLGWRGHTSGDRRGGGSERQSTNGERQGPQLGWRGHTSGDRRGGGSERQSTNGERQGPQLGFKTLQDISKQEPSVVAITLSLHPAMPDLLKETNMEKNRVELLCLVLSKAFTAKNNRSTVQHLARLLKDSGFFRTTLPHYLAGMWSELNPVRRKQELENIVVILTQVLTIFPASSVEAVGLLLTLLQASMNKLQTAGVNIPAQVAESVEKLENLVKHVQDRSCEGTLHPGRDTYSLLHSDVPGEEEEQPIFRNLPIFPTPEELEEESRPSLRSNIISKRYTNTLIYLDTHFRLMREDLLRGLREGIQLLRQKRMELDDTELKKKRFDDILVYFDVKIGLPHCIRTNLAYGIQFDVQPLKSVRWENSKRLLYGSLVCLSSDNFESFLYATVVDRDPKQVEKGKILIAFTDESRLKLTGIEKDQVFVMVETPAYFEAYRHVLEGLQEQNENDMPFQRYIVECNTDVHPPAYLQENDLYNLTSITLRELRLPPFHILKEEAWPRQTVLGLNESQMQALRLALTKELAIIQGPPGTGKTHVGLKIAHALLDNREHWNNSQMLVVCFTNHALDQFLEGILKFLPNGIVRVGGRSNSELLKRFNIKELTSGPSSKMPLYLRNAFRDIYLEMDKLKETIQYQNSRLQCSLEGILADSILENIISQNHWDSLHQHLGYRKGNLKSSVILEWLGLHSTGILQMETEDTDGDGFLGAATGDEMVLWQQDLIHIVEEAEMIQADRIIDDNTDLKRGKNMAYSEWHFRNMQESMLAMNLEQDKGEPEQPEEEWMYQRQQKRKMINKMKRELSKSETMSEEEEKNVLHIWALSMQDRWRLYRLWVVRYRADIRTGTVPLEDEYQQAVDRYNELKHEQTRFILQRAKVIGMTTTGASKFRKVLQEVRPRVVIVEEAAEVLEAHIITTLSQACQHLILIGDHQQLRPTSTVYDLEKNYKMGVSMFERLVGMRLPFVRLNQQHRMRPEIARLLTPNIYSDLENHPSVLNFDDIRGLNTNVFFVEHNELETQFKEDRSHQNLHEAQFVVAFCRYLLLQEYKPEQITILTTYTAQLHCLHKLMPGNLFKGVRVHVVDKYQGEENDIVLLSLVRSNTQGKVGFLNISNRVCVALSRAKKGLYCMGNSEMLGKVQLWKNTFRTLKEKDQIGRALTLCCQNHAESKIEASCADDFKQAPEGGCTKPCEFRLDCGHVCESVCHPYDKEHQKYQCLKNCERILCPLGHKCSLKCFADCPKDCPIRIEKIIPKCQHKQMVPCHQDPEEFICKVPCQKTLLCGHRCDSMCGIPCTSKCMVKVMLQLSCGHNQLGACFHKTMKHAKEPLCMTSCGQQLKCNHACRGTCGQCNNGRFHLSCNHRCKRLLICSHECTEPCTSSCPPCDKPCENCCVHSKCMNKCGQHCAPCNEPCAWQCVHQSCSKLCHEPCDRPPCDQPCTLTLTCGHPCIGLCGEKCPSKCRICHEDKVTEIFFGTEDDPKACFLQLEDCGHIVEHTSMDTYMAIDDEPQASEGQLAIKLKECPKCRTPIRKNLRYGSHINRSLAAIEMVKTKIRGSQGSINLQRLELLDTLGSYKINSDKDMKIKKILRSKDLTANDLWVIQNNLNFIDRIEKLLSIVRQNTTLTNICEFQKSINNFLLWNDQFSQKFTEQQMFDMQRELQRLTLRAELIVLCSRAEKKGKHSLIESETQIMKETLGKNGQFTEQDGKRLKDVIEEMKQKVSVTGLDISEEEKKMIVTAMKLQPGHWYKCPNGHVYVITECGGAMESRQCPDCKATIGGSSHRLADGNQVASEMDGAQHAAWSEANNLINFEDLHL
ncbi:NFX1-type zinc finger-containing protein 1 isoform X1 [Entelurus aequoreus]|uniref:NFX1-type zinc finger-containing protein 1 isoform X1 n=1 Tax=Entelurus aequoreus TaxID=161455 RepID=UPI002B1DC88E|nr:NFX1-type zinc finger-containing protein 1 isoform X1 [Entelurus aequoreus]XP_061894236.1 NFX1-type zinc finger-containing protein 1 isoform X1 [Entelurus aequoreus]XP_061894237.1 NFX1-type zinc finger-containing protein 1 isoform X1 [Entelurus aequoreus]